MKKKKILNKLLTLLTVAVMCFCLFAIPAFADLPTSSLDTEYSLRLSGTSSDPVYHYLTTGSYTATRQYTGDWQSFGVMICALDSSGNPITNLNVLVDNGFTQWLVTEPDFTSYSYGAYGYTWDYESLPEYGATIGITITNLPYDSYVIAFAFSDEYSDYFADTMAVATQYNYALSARLSAPNYYDDGYDDGYTVGFNSGEQYGYNNGYDVGVSEFNKVPEAVFSIVSAPFAAITNFLNFEIFGINLKSIIGFLLMAVLVVFVMKKVKD